jgi:sulfate transport system ATP-binding protein
MNEGRIEQVGTPEEVFHSPKTAFVMNFLGYVNLFHGRMEEGKVRFATVSCDAPDHAPASADAVMVFVRPHELDVDTKRNGHASFSATVLRVSAAGPNVRLEMVADSGDPIHAEIPQERFRALNISRGSRVFVTPREIRVFRET